MFRGCPRSTGGVAASDSAAAWSSATPDSERFFALITKHIDTNSAAIATAARWVAPGTREYRRARPRTVRCLSEHPAVVVAGERMDEDSGWYALRPGELLHVDRRLAPIHRTIIDHPLSSTGAALVPPPPNPAPDATVLAIMIGRVSLMPLVHPSDPGRPGREEVSVNPVFTREPVLIPRNRIPEDELDSDIAYQVVHDELMLDGNARLNLATFVTTWMEPQAQRLMAESFDKNMIDKDEYPRTAELEQRCVRMLADLWHTTDPDHTTGCSTTGSSEACMLAGLALKRRWQHRRRAEGKPTDRPNMVMGVNVQVCWEKFANYWEVEARLVPMDGDRFHLTAEEVVKYCDENTIGVVVILGSTFDGSYEPVAEICAALDDLQHERGWDIQVHVDGASGAMIAPFCDPDLEWDFRLPRVASINTSGHKYGLVYPGVGWVVWRDVDALPSDLVFKVNYLGGDMPTFALNFSRPGAQIIAQYYNFLRLGVDGYRRVQQYCREVASTLADRIAALGPFRLITDGRELPVFAFTLAPGEEGYSVFDVSAALREQGWLVPAYTFPAHREDLQVLRIVVRNGFTHDLADLLVTALEQALPRLRGQEKPQRGPEAASFSHGADAARTHDPVTTTPS